MRNQYYWSLEDPVMDVIAHHGVKGQSWGKRQWQNPDGSLTPAGRIHYGIGKAMETAKKVLSYDVGKGISDKIRDFKYGKTYDTDVIGNYKSKLGKTQYTNLDGTLNEKGKKLASEFTTKEIDKNTKYFDKKINHYKKAAEAYKDQPEIAKKFQQMAKSAEESRDRTNENLKNLSIDQMLQIQMQRNQKAAKIAAGAAGVVGAGALVGAAVNEDFNKAASDMFNSIGPDTLMDTVNDLSQTEVGQRALKMVDTSIRTYADARAYVVGTALDQSMNRLNAMGVPQKAGQMVGAAANEAALSIQTSGAAENYAKIGSTFINTFVNESSGSVDTFANSINNLATSANNVSTAANNIAASSREVRNAIAGSSKAPAASTKDYVESLANAGMTAVQIANQTGLSEALIKSIL